MVPLAASPSDNILLGCIVPCLAFVILSAYAVISSRYQSRLLELKLHECQINGRLTEKESEVIIKAFDVQVLALTSENGRLSQQVLDLEKKHEELLCLVGQRDAEYSKRSAEVEAIWSKERGDIQRVNDLEIMSFKVNLRAVEAVCASRGYQIQALTQAKEELLAARVQHEHKILELTDKLSEYHRRLTGNYDFPGLPLSPSYSKQPQGSSEYDDLRHTRTAPEMSRV